MTQSAANYASMTVGNSANVIPLPTQGDFHPMSESEKRDARMIDRIRMMINVHEHLRSYAAAVQVSVENASVVLRGKLPTHDLKRQLIPAIRQGGVLLRIDNCIQVPA